MKTQELKTWHQGTPTVEETISHWHLFIWKTINRILVYNVSKDEKDEVYQDVCLRLVKMPEDKRRFNSYLCQTIINEVRVRARFILRSTHLRNPIPLIVGQDGNEDQMDFPAPPNGVQYAEALIFLEQLIQDLKPERREVIRMSLSGYTHQEIAKRFNKTDGWVNMIVQAFRRSKGTKRLLCAEDSWA